MEIVNSAIIKAHLIPAMRDVRMIGFGVFQQSLIHIGFDFVIAVHKTNPLARGFSYSMQACRRNAVILLKDGLYTVVLFSVLPDNVGAAVK